MSPSTLDRMSPLDATFLYVEDGTTHMHIGSCAILDGPQPTFDEILALIAGTSHPSISGASRFMVG